MTDDKDLLRDEIKRAEWLCDIHNSLAGLERGHARKTDVWHIFIALQSLAKRDGFDLRAQFDEAMAFYQELLITPQERIVRALYCAEEYISNIPGTDPGNSTLELIRSALAEARQKL